MERKEALDLLKKHVTTDQLLRHSLAVEASMMRYAAKYEEDVKRWGLIGLLHDIDFEKHPDVHPKMAPDLLEGSGLDEAFVETILSHGLNTEIPRDTKAKQCLHAVDQMSSFIIAVALMRPTGFEGLKAKSVKKKMKDKAFAKAVDRTMLTEAYEALGVELAEHVDMIVEGLMSQEARLSEEGYSLLG